MGHVSGSQSCTVANLVQMKVCCLMAVFQSGAKLEGCLVQSIYISKHSQVQRSEPGHRSRY